MPACLDKLTRNPAFITSVSVLKIEVDLAGTIFFVSYNHFLLMDKFVLPLDSKA
jgi:hypothetical protein